MKKIVLSLLALSVLSIQACYYGNEEDIYGTGGNCQTTNMRFRVEMTTIMTNKCLKCHVEGGTDYSGIKLDTYNDWKKYAGNGRLVSRVFDASSPMPPKTEGTMSDCDKAAIKAWVEQGALDN
jgi:uncharacterized membrane protein